MIPVPSFILTTLMQSKFVIFSHMHYNASIFSDIFKWYCFSVVSGVTLNHKNIMS